MIKKTLKADFCTDTATGEEYVVAEYSDGKETFLKTMSVETFANAVRPKSESNFSGYCRLGLPHGIYDLLLGKDGGYAAVISVPEHFAAYLTTQRAYGVRLPGIVMIVRVTSTGHLAGGSCWCYDSRMPLTDETPLYYFPFGNVYDDGHICFGSNSVSIKSVSEAGNAVSVFLSAPDSGHLNNPEHRKAGYGIGGMLEELQKAGDVPFDYEGWLVPTGRTLGQEIGARTV